jgi:hypothetical protein
METELDANEPAEQEESVVTVMYEESTETVLKWLRALGIPSLEASVYEEKLKKLRMKCLDDLIMAAQDLNANMRRYKFSQHHQNAIRQGLKKFEPRKEALLAAQAKNKKKEAGASHEQTPAASKEAEPEEKDGQGAGGKQCEEVSLPVWLEARSIPSAEAKVYTASFQKLSINSVEDMLFNNGVHRSPEDLTAIMRRCRVKPQHQKVVSETTAIMRSLEEQKARKEEASRATSPNEEAPRANSPTVFQVQATPEPQEPQKPAPKGALVVIHGQNSRPELNNQMGVTMGFDEKKGRYTVQLTESGKMMAFGLKNLSLYVPKLPPSELAVNAWVYHCIETGRYQAQVVQVYPEFGACDIMYADGNGSSGVPFDQIELFTFHSKTGDRVLRCFQGVFYPATIIDVDEENKCCTIVYDDGHDEAQVLWLDIHPDANHKQNKKNVKKALEAKTKAQIPDHLLSKRELEARKKKELKKEYKRKKKEGQAKQDAEDLTNMAIDLVTTLCLYYDSGASGPGAYPDIAAFWDDAVADRIAAEKQQKKEQKKAKKEQEDLMKIVAEMEQQEAEENQRELDSMMMMEQMAQEMENEERKEREKLLAIQETIRAQTTISSSYNPARFETKLWLDTKMLPTQVAVAKVESQGTSIHFTIRLCYKSKEAVDLFEEDDSQYTSALKRYDNFDALRSMLSSSDGPVLESATSTKFPKRPMVSISAAVRERLRGQLDAWLVWMLEIALRGDLTSEGHTQLAHFLLDPSDIIKSKDENLKQKREFDKARKQLDEYTKVSNGIYGCMYIALYLLLTFVHEGNGETIDEDERNVEYGVRSNGPVQRERIARKGSILLPEPPFALHDRRRVGGEF